MRNNGVGEMALVCVSALAQSLQLLEVGKIGVLSFGTGVSEICPLDDTSGGSKISTVRELSESLKFNEESTSSFSDAFPAVIQKCTDVFLHQDDGGTGGSLALIITDGRFDKEKCRPYVQSLIQLGHIPVLIVMDANKQESILSITSVHFEEVTSGPVKKRKIVRKPFLSQSDCPFPFYAVIQEPSQLPTTLADIIRQWIEISTK
jgi:midasin